MCPPEVVRWSTVTHKTPKNRLPKNIFYFSLFIYFWGNITKLLANNLKLSAHRLMLSVGKKINKTNK